MTNDLTNRFPISQSVRKRNPHLFGGKIQDAKPERDKKAALGGNSLHPLWTEDEDFTLRCYYSGHPKDKEFTVKPLLAMLNRSEAAIHCRADALGITFSRGKQPRNPATPRPPRERFSADERRNRRSNMMKERHANTPHPMLGRPVSMETRKKLSDSNKGRTVSSDVVLRRLKTAWKNKTLNNYRPHGSWKSGWRVVGGKRFYARSRWEANYGRYLEFLKLRGEIQEWEHEPETFWFESIRRGSRSYLPDFRVTHLGGTIEYHEVKGWMDSRSRTKIRRMAKYYPKVILRVFDSKWFSANQTNLRILIPDWENKE